jgi:MFS family permease
VAAPRTPRPFTVAMIVDSAGDGMWAPFSLLFFVYGKHLPLAAAGSALSIGALVALAGGGLLAGVVADRLGHFRTAALSSLLRGVAFPCYLLTDNLVVIAVLSGAIGFGVRLFWAANGGLVAAITSESTARTRLFAMQNSLRNIGMGLGALATVAASSLQHARSGAFYTLIVAFNAVSFIVAAACLWYLRALDEGRGAADAPQSPPGPAAPPVSYRTVLRDRPFVVYCLAALVLALASVTFGTILPVFLLKAAGLPAWAPGAAFLVACAVIPSSQPMVHRLSERVRALPLMVASAAVSVGYFLALPAVPHAPPAARYPLLLVLIVAFGFGQALLGAVMSTVVLEYAPKAARGRYNAFFQMSWGAASALGPGLFSLLFTISPTVLWLALAVASAVAAIVLQALREPAPARPDEPAARPSALQTKESSP